MNFILPLCCEFKIAARNLSDVFTKQSIHMKFWDDSIQMFKEGALHRELKPSLVCICNFVGCKTEKVIRCREADFLCIV